MGMSVCVTLHVQKVLLIADVDLIQFPSISSPRTQQSKGKMRHLKSDVKDQYAVPRVVKSSVYAREAKEEVLMSF